MSLENTFYILAIICMSLSLIILIALVTAVFVIKHKINQIHRHIEERLHDFTNIVEKGGEFVGRVAKKVRK